MHLDNILIRGCENESELKAVVDLCDRAFQNTSKEYFERHMYKDKTLKPCDTRVLLKNGKIVSSVQVFPRNIYMNGKIIKMGGIGNVATLPAERERGYAGMLLIDAIEYMKNRHMLVSMLTTTINKYYEKFGFKTIKRHVFIGGIGEPIRDDNVRRFEEQRDLRDVMELYEKYNESNTGPIVRDLKYWTSQLEFSDDDKDLFLVYETNGKVVAYIRSKRLDNRLKVLEYSFEGKRSELIITLLKHAMYEAKMDIIELYVSEKEKSRLSFLSNVHFRTDTDLMATFLDSRLATGDGEVLFKENYVTFWQTDFF